MGWFFPYLGTFFRKNHLKNHPTLPFEFFYWITVHSAKGTEASICFVAGAKQGTYPHVRAFGDIESEEEERRVLYVAMTRAKNELYVTRSTDYRSGFWVLNTPTKGEEYFLADVPEKLIAHKTEYWLSSPTGGLNSLEDIY